MAANNKRGRRKLQLGDELPPDMLAKLKQTMHQHRDHVLENQVEYPDPTNATEVVLTDKPATFKHPASKTARKVRKSRLRGAQRPDTDS